MKYWAPVSKVPNGLLRVAMRPPTVWLFSNTVTLCPACTKVRAQDLDGNWFEIEGSALLARCLLHELDHLTGKLLVDFVGPLKRTMIKKKLTKLKGSEASDAEA